ncbi:MAG: restriction endonuclease subunit R [Candidatus Zeuxoniibacter abyssi]|nr:MAG: restriction endonuclease subunit R [Candidatus Persebacteraceae bacterium AB1(2)]
MSGRKPIEFIQATNPVVIIDEPQSVDNTEKAKRAIDKLTSVFTLRYSATYRTPYNLLYKLDPIRAYDLRLVKRIEVASVRADGELGNAYVKLLKTDNKKGIKAQVEFYKESGGVRQLWIKNNDDLFDKSGKHEIYRNGYMVNEIDCRPNAEYVEFSNGQRLNLGQATGGLNDEIMQQQVYATVEEHLKKELAFKDKEVKVLSLFFIDRVANYRIYGDDGTTTLGKIGQWFEDAYKKLTAKGMYKALAVKNMAAIHNGYFSKDNKGRGKDTTGNSKDDEGTYELIMRDKERLLSAETPLRFIFSHSALREGWDNPNVFQICTLNELRSAEKKRQEIGRGLRLPVNEQGERIHDENVNRLTVIANESYEDFANALQNEFEHDYGIRFGIVEKHAFTEIQRELDGEKLPIGKLESAKIWKKLCEHGYVNNNGKVLDKFNSDKPELTIGVEYDDINADIIDVIQGVIFRRRIKDARKTHKIKFNKQVQLSPEFSALWDKIKHRTRYRVSYKTEKLIQCAVGRIKKMEKIKPIRISVTGGEIVFTDDGVYAHEVRESVKDYNGIEVLPDLLAYLQEHTELTRHTLVEIINRSERIDEFQGNPQKFMAAVAHEISRALHDLILAGIQYEKVAGHYWQMSRVEKDAENDIVRYLGNLYEVKNQEKCIVDRIAFDSEVERRFAEDLDNHENVRLFVKLPRWFKIDTPIGSYNPDWAFMTENHKKLYFVRETKGSTDNDLLRKSENQKIKCGEHHFNTLGVDYDVVTKLSEVEF